MPSTASSGEASSPAPTTSTTESPSAHPSPKGVTAKSPAASKNKRDQRFGRRGVLIFVLIGVVIVAGLGWSFFGLDLLNGKLGVAATLATIGLFFVAQFVRYRQRISLRTLMIVVTVISVGLAFVGRKLAIARQETQAVERLTERGAQISYADFNAASPNAYFETEGGWFLPRWVRETLGNSFFSQVSEIDLGKQSIRDRDLALLADLRGATSLSLRHSQVTAKGISSIPLIPGVKSITLNWRQLNEASAARLMQFPEVRQIDLRVEPGVAPSTPEVSALSGWDSLEKVYLFELNNLDAAGAAALAGLPALRSLSFGDWFRRPGRIPFDTEAYPILARSKTIRHLSINIAEFSDKELAALESMSSLESITLIGTLVTPEGVRRFQKARPAVTVKGNF